MKILIISDSHGNIVRLKHVIGYANSSGVNAIIHCGDWDNTEAVLTMQKVAIPVYGVLGNADVDPSILTSLRNANVVYDTGFLKLEIDGRNIGVCHFPPSSRRSFSEGGLRRGKPLQDALESGQYDILFHGHTHKKKDKMFGKTRVVNPGALQKTLVPSFAVYNTETNGVEFVDVVI